MQRFCALYYSVLCAGDLAVPLPSLLPLTSMLHCSFSQRQSVVCGRMSGSRASPPSSKGKAGARPVPPKQPAVASKPCRRSFSWPTNLLPPNWAHKPTAHPTVFGDRRLVCVQNRCNCEWNLLHAHLAHWVLWGYNHRCLNGYLILTSTSAQSVVHLIFTSTLSLSLSDSLAYALPSPLTPR